jgi:hypothetical protein
MLSYRLARALVLSAVLIGCDREKAAPGPAGDAKGAVSATLEDSLKSGDITIVDAVISPADSTDRTRGVIEVRFDPAIASDRTVTIRPDDRSISLRDDGRNGDRVAKDGVFSGIAAVNPAEFTAEQTRFARARGDVMPASFVGRVRVPTQVRRELLQDFRRARVGARIPLVPLAIPDPNLQTRSLMITAIPVVTDPSRTFDPCTSAGTPMGKWTFGHLMTEMANQTATGVTPADFVRQWLAQWETQQTVNTFAIPARTQIQASIITPWETASGGTTLDLSKAPFRLLAIVNRVDLRQNVVYGGGSGGEGRFVFGAIDRRNGGCQPLPFAIIFEYGIRVNSCPALRVWAKKWHDLKALPPNDPTFLSSLEAITETFVKAGANSANPPNNSALNQLRTNENALNPLWELREFRLGMAGGTPGHLTSVTVKQEPDASFNNSAVLAAYVNANAASINLGKHVIPEVEPISGQRFLAARSPVPTPSFFWGRGSDMTTANSRFNLSLNTCSGCHAGETRTFFTHVSPTSALPAQLSQFLTGTPAPGVHDPDNTDADESDRMFADLERRALDLDGLVNSPCLKQIGVRPLFRMVH